MTDTRPRPAPGPALASGRLGVVSAAFLLGIVALALLAAPPAAAQDDDPEIRYRDAVAAIRRELDSGREARAQRQVRQALDDLIEIGPADPDPAILGRLLMFEALAAAARDLPDTTAWTWSLARSIDPSLADENLRRWRQAGRRLATLVQRPPGDDGDVISSDSAAGDGSPSLNLFTPPVGVAVVLPQQQKRPEPRFPPSLRGRGIRGPVILQVVIDRRGRPRDPLVRESPHPLLSYATAEAVREWRFEPATVDGQRVEVIYEIRFDLEPE